VTESSDYTHKQVTVVDKSCPYHKRDAAKFENWILGPIGCKILVRWPSQVVVARDHWKQQLEDERASHGNASRDTSETSKTRSFVSTSEVTFASRYLAFHPTMIGPAHWSTSHFLFVAYLNLERHCLPSSFSYCFGRFSCNAFVRVFKKTTSWRY